MKISSKYTLMWVFESVICLVLVFGVIKFMTQNIGQDTKALQHLNNTVATIGQIKEYILEAESGQRGFLITKNPSYLDGYRYRLDQISEKMRDLHLLVNHDAEQKKYFNELNSVVDGKIKEMNSIIDLRDKNFEEAKEAVKTNRGKKLMDSVKYNLNKMRDREIETLENYKNETYKRLIFMCWLFPTVMIANLSMLILSYYTIREQEGLK